MKPRKEMIRMGTKVGAVIGAIAFLIFGIIPGFYFGSYGALVLLSHLNGGPLQATVLVRVATAIGILLGISFLASLCIVAGGILGTVIGYTSELLSNAVKVGAHQQAASKAE